MVLLSWIGGTALVVGVVLVAVFLIRADIRKQSQGRHRGQ